MRARGLSRLELQRRLGQPGSDVEHVRAVAAGLIGELGIDEPPVDMRMVASMLGIASVRADPSLTAAGFLLCSLEGDIEIRYRASDSLQRQRFTIGHECSHTFFPGFETTTQFRCAPSVRQRRELDLEALCDVGASELLLPSLLIARDVEGMEFGLDAVEQLAMRYDASIEATANRVVDLWREPSALLVFSLRQKPSQNGTAHLARLRLDRVHSSGDWPFFITHKSVVFGDVFDRAHEGERVAEPALLRGITKQTVAAEVHARAYPFTMNGCRNSRVIALVRRVKGRINVR